jgi:hypothetical protein
MGTTLPDQVGPPPDAPARGDATDGPGDSLAAGAVFDPADLRLPDRHSWISKRRGKCGGGTRARWRGRADGAAGPDLVGGDGRPSRSKRKVERPPRATTTFVRHLTTARSKFGRLLGANPICSGDFIPPAGAMIGHAQTPEDHVRRDARVRCSRPPGLISGAAITSRSVVTSGRPDRAVRS